jgi:hypothetical protein
MITTVLFATAFVAIVVSSARVIRPAKTPATVNIHITFFILMVYFLPKEVPTIANQPKKVNAPLGCICN